MRISGKGTYASIMRQMVEFDDVEGHAIFVSEWEGRGWETGEHILAGETETHFISYGDYIKGNGPLGLY